MAFALLALMIALRIADPVFLQTIRLRTFDIYQQVKPREYTKKPVVIVDIDEASIKAQGQWPWSRVKIASLIENIAARGAIVVGFDILFAEEDRLSPRLIAQDNKKLPEEIRKTLSALTDNEQAMAEIMRKFRVVLARSGLNKGPDEKKASSELIQTPSVSIGASPNPWLLNYPGIVTNLNMLEKAAAGFGMISIRADKDGVIRRVPAAMIAEGKLYPSLAIELLRVASGKNAYAIKTDQAGVKSVVVAGVEIPTDQNGQIWLHFTKSVPQRFVSATSILDGSVPASQLAGRLVLVGTSAVGLQDLRPTPLDPQMPGVEIHAQMLESVLGKHYLTRPNYAIGAELVSTVLLSTLIIFLVPAFGALLSIIFGGILGLSVVGLSVYLYLEKSILIDAGYPLMVSFSLFAVLVSFNYLREERERQQIRGAFSQYIAPALVQQLVRDPDRLVLGGETREITILFTDVRGFTSISESMKDDPQGLTELINRLLTPLSNAIVERQGTIDKYMGDAIMAFWNAPLDDPDHGKNACSAALSMIEEVEVLNAVFKKEAIEAGRTPREISIGIGLNTGTSVVGNMGTDMRFDYTALGDSVNLAARLEGQSKTYGVPVIIGENTAKYASDSFATLEIDFIQVKGKTDPEHIYALFGGSELAHSEDFKALRALNASMLSSYRTQQWESAFEAVALCSDLAEKAGLELEEYLFLYQARISEYRANPPGKSWKGVYTATSK